VASLLLDKPTKLNALDEEMLAEIEQHFEAWERAGDVTVVIIGSTSERAFCVGADLDVLAGLNPQTMQAWELHGSRVLDCVQNSPLLSVAAISGHALGGGLTLAAACDFRIASEQATFAQPEINLGWIPGWCGVARLARIVGVPQAKELCATGRRIDAGAAQAMGLIQEFVPAAEFENRVANFARELAARSTPALRAIKQRADSCSPLLAPTAARFDALLNAELLADPRGLAALAEFRARKAKKSN